MRLAGAAQVVRVETAPPRFCQKPVKPVGGGVLHPGQQPQVVTATPGNERLLVVCICIQNEKR